MRIRTVKPEWLQDDRLISAGSDARVLSIALLLLADDYGNGRLSRATIAFVFPDEPESVFRKALAKLDGWYVEIYSVREQQYFHVCNWDKHQRIDNAGKARVPAPLDADSSVSRRVAASRGESPLDLDPDQDQDLDLIPPVGRAKTRRAAAVKSEHIEELFEYWRERCSNATSKLIKDQDRWKLLKSAIRAYGLANCKLVVDGALKSPHHMGQNDRGTKFLKSELLFRNSEKIEQFIGYNTNPPRAAAQKHSESAQFAIDAIADQKRRQAKWSQ